MRCVLTLAAAGLRESRRDRVFLGLLLFLFLLLLLAAWLSTLAIGDHARVSADCGLAGMAFICLLMTILAGIFGLYREQERNELYVLLNRVPRGTYLLGRFAGMAVILALFSIFSGVAILLLTRFFGGLWLPGLAWAVLWNFTEFTLLAGVGLLFYAAGLGFTLNALLLFGVFIVGHSMREAIESFIALGRYGAAWHLELVRVISYLFPNFDLFDFRLAIIHREPLAPARVALSLGYWFFYLTALLSAAGALFKRRDL
jgi:hypothetical protein